MVPRSGEHAGYVASLGGCVCPDRSPEPRCCWARAGPRGCTTLGPDFEPPEATVPDQWLEPSKPKEDPVEATLEAEAPAAETPDETAVMAHADWWTVFSDPVLNQLIELAYAQNLTLRQAGVRILTARAQLGIAVGNQYPQSQVGAGSFTTSRASTESGLLNGPIGTVAPAGTTEWSGGLNAGWELDFWGKFRRGIESADANLIASIASYDNVLVLLTSEVASYLCGDPHPRGTAGARPQERGDTGAQPQDCRCAFSQRGDHRARCAGGDDAAEKHPGDDTGVRAETCGRRRMR